MVIPAGDPPDAEYNMVALDQSGTKGVYSGVAVKWTGETGTRQDGGDPTFRNIKLKPNEVSAYIDISDKTLRNALAAGQMCMTLLRSAIIGSEEDTFYTGSGVGMPLGIIGHGASIEITRTTASTIKYADVVEMFARSKGTSLVWVMSKTALPQIMKMEDTEGHLIWQANAAAGPGGVLLGIPVMFNDQSPVLGSTGDLALIDFSYYAIKDGSPLAIFMDPYTQKVNGLTRIYAFWNVDGQPTITTPLLARDGVTTYSPFVVLK
jgi:HK97 family phage major capsid protein